MIASHEYAFLYAKQTGDNATINLRSTCNIPIAQKLQQQQCCNIVVILQRYCCKYCAVWIIRKNNLLGGGREGSASKKALTKEDLFSAVTHSTLRLFFFTFYTGINSEDGTKVVKYLYVV